MTTCKGCQCQICENDECDWCDCEECQGRFEVKTDCFAFKTVTQNNTKGGKTE